MARYDTQTGRIAGMATLAFATVSLIFGSTSTAVATDCFDDQRIGLFTERHFSELDAKTRSKAGDPKIDHMATTALRGTRANIVSINADTKDNAVTQARGDGLPVIAYLNVDASSSKIEMQYGKTSMVTVETAARLQFLSSADGAVLSESSDFEKSAGLDIEHALPDMLEPTLATMAEEAAREACRNGLSGSTVVAKADVATAPARPIEDRTLVSDIQYLLIDLGYEIGEADGIAGGLTKTAIKQVEQDLRLPATGEPSAGLRTKLQGRLKQVVTETQSLLKALGRVKGEPSGVLTGETVQAIETVELKHNLPFDGKPDNDVLSILRAELRGGETQTSSTSSNDDPALRLRVERLLFKLGFLETPPSGQETFESREAIVRAETEFGLSKVDGQPDIELYRVLDAAARGS